ncbi:MAG: hypothetical protein WC831_03930 [Parcubacteria group bacterium]|jgi:hypothetical protein
MENMQAGLADAMEVVRIGEERLKKVLMEIKDPVGLLKERVNQGVDLGKYDSEIQKEVIDAMQERVYRGIKDLNIISGGGDDLASLPQARMISQEDYEKLNALSFGIIGELLSVVEERELSAQSFIVAGTAYYYNVTMNKRVQPGKTKNQPEH